MSEIPEIEGLRTVRLFPDLPAEAVVLRSDAESAIRSALDRQAREIVEWAEDFARGWSDGGRPSAGADALAERLAARFAPKKADPR